MKRSKLNNDKITALYCGLSKDDGTNNENIRPAIPTWSGSAVIRQRRDRNARRTASMINCSTISFMMAHESQLIRETYRSHYRLEIRWIYGARAAPAIRTALHSCSGSRLSFRRDSFAYCGKIAAFRTH